MLESRRWQYPAVAGVEDEVRPSRGRCSACGQQNGSWCRLMENNTLNRFSAVLSALLYQYFWKETASWENQLERTDCESNILMRLQGAWRQPEDKFYSQIFQFSPASANSRKLWSKLNSKDYILTLTFSLAKTVNGVLQLLLTANKLLDLTAHLAIFLAVSGSSELGKTPCPLPGCHG